MGATKGDRGNTTRARVGSFTSPGSAVNDPRTEGQRRLLEVPDSLSVIAAAVGVGKTVVSYWRSGEKLPGPGPRARLREAYGIEPADWERVPGARPAPARAASSSSSASSAGPAAPPAGKPTTIAEVDEQLRMLRELQEEPGLVPSERVRLADSMGKLLAIKARLERDAELLEDRIVREHPFYGRLEATILAALRPFPDAARAVADALGELEGDPA